jgi:hypothetical protein
VSGGQLGIDLWRAARVTDPDTSHAAAADASGNAATHRARALRELRAVYPDGLTDFELAARLNLQQTSIGKRRGELRDAGLVEDSGTRRPAPSGSASIVWRWVP